jgi:hypothetical protein
MGSKCLTCEEKVIFLLGLAIMWRFERASGDADMPKRLDPLLRRARGWLSPDELALISRETGILFDDDFFYALEGDLRAFSRIFPDVTDDDIPF